ncbi:MAG: ATP-binding protein [Archaeoglobaceae archaeon]
MTKAKPIGLVKGPSESHHEFRFITPDKTALKTGEYIYYLHNDKKVICRITRRSPLRLYPDIYLSKPEINPQKIIRALGINAREFELFDINASIMGYFDSKIGFINPRIPPKPGESIYLAESDTIQEVLMKKKKEDIGSVNTGNLLNREEDVPVVLDTSLITSEHMCILASTGSGKSYLSGVLVEELLKPNNSAAVLILDPHGEYHTLNEVEGIEELRNDGYRPNVKILGKDEIKIRISELEYDELVGMLPDLTDRMEALLNRAFREMKGSKFTAKNLVDKILEIAGDDDVSAKGLIWRINRYISNVEIVDDYVHLELKDLLLPGQASVLQLNEVSDIEQQILTSVLMKRILNARINAEKDLNGEQLDYPAFLLIEEGHRFASRDARSYKVLRTILAEGRKFGIGICLISQRPSKIDPDILSQCMSQIIMRIVNPADQENIKASVESIGRDMIEELPGLTKGQALVAGVAINSPVLMRVRERLTSHGGISKNAPQEWIKWTNTSGQEEEELPRQKKQDKLFWDT